jgi:hypothetical protein
VPSAQLFTQNANFLTTVLFSRTVRFQQKELVTPILKPSISDLNIFKRAMRATK